MAELTHPRAPTHDPAWLGRVFWASLCVVLLWPLGVATEFKPWVLLEPDNVKISAQFIGSFWPLVFDAEFLAMVACETWRTVAMATAGVTLALVVAVPLTLLNTRVLSISALSGRMARGPYWLRQSVRWLLIFLRSMPELVWALVFVRVVGLGPRPACWRSRSPTAACWARCTVKFWKAAKPTPPKPCCATAVGGCKRFFTVCCPPAPPS